MFWRWHGYRHAVLAPKPLFFGVTSLLLLLLSVIALSRFSSTKTTFDSKKRGISMEMKSLMQSKLTDEFCTRSNLNHLKFKLPHHWKERQSIFRHLLVDDSEKLLFAYLPKVASSHIRRFMCVLTGILHEDTIHLQKLSTEELRACINNSTFLRKDLNDGNRIMRLKNYWKVAILRNPLHRLVSAYRDKIIGLELKPHEREWSLSIMRKYNKTSPDFESYLRWITDTPNQQLNEHFAPMVELIQPCRVDYDYYGNFKDLSMEMSLIAEKIGVPLKYFVDEDYYSLASGNRTDNLVASFYASVSDKVKEALFWDFYEEFKFYYNLFPEESSSHVRLLGVHEGIGIYKI